MPHKGFKSIFLHEPDRIAILMGGLKRSLIKRFEISNKSIDISLSEGVYPLDMIYSQRFKVGTVFIGKSDLNLTSDEFYSKHAKFEVTQNSPNKSLHFTAANILTSSW